jgi:uncharacterized protein (DUF305 family)
VPGAAAARDATALAAALLTWQALMPAPALAQHEGHEQHATSNGAVTGASAATAPAAAAATPLYSQDDLLFLTHMIVHHRQALELTAMVPSRSKREEFLRFARYLDGAQSAEIDQMQSLLDLAAARGVNIPHHEMHGDPPMAGMLSKAQMAAISAAQGKEFERLWLEGMILHHEGALDMALVQQEREFASGRRSYGIDVLVDDMLAVQRAEVTKMKAWLEQWR